MHGVFGGLFEDPLGDHDVSSLSATDHLNSKVTVLLLIAFSALVTAKHYAGSMVSCWCPPHFTGAMVAYTNQVCWTTNTYYLPFEKDRIPKDDAEKQGGMIGYYQWVALIFLFQAVLFYLPRPVWRALNKRSGIAVSTITDAALEYQKQMTQEEKEKTMGYMVKHLSRYLNRLNRMYNEKEKEFARKAKEQAKSEGKLIEEKSFCGKIKDAFRCCGENKVVNLWRYYGNYLFVTYIFVKLLYIANVVVQIVLLNEFLGMDYHMYGFRVMGKMFSGQDWTTSDRFPRVTLCDFKIRSLGNIHPYTVQCSLPMNLFNEILFIVIWFWLFFVGVVSVCSLLLWLKTSIWMPEQRKEIKRRLMARDMIDSDEKKKKVKRFVDVYLKRDGCFILKLVMRNASEIIASELVAGLFKHYLEKEAKFDKRVAKQSLTPGNHLTDSALVPTSPLSEKEALLADMDNNNR